MGGLTMKRVNNIYHIICDLDRIMYFEHVVSVNTVNKKKVEKFQEHYVENIYNFPNSHKVLKDRIINACYDILENVYRANVDNSIEPKKEAIVQIKMLNFYFKQALDKELIMVLFI